VSLPPACSANKYSILRPGDMYTRVNFMRYGPLNFYLEVKSHDTERAGI